MLSNLENKRDIQKLLDKLVEAANHYSSYNLDYDVSISTLHDKLPQVVVMAAIVKETLDAAPKDVAITMVPIIAIVQEIMAKPYAGARGAQNGFYVYKLDSYGRQSLCPTLNIPYYLLIVIKRLFSIVITRMFTFLTITPIISISRPVFLLTTPIIR